MWDIQDRIGRPALLEQLAEEATELAKAALKQARVLRKENPTPVTYVETEDNLIEEYTDTIHCARELGLKIDDEQITKKDRRWNERLDSM